MCLNTPIISQVVFRETGSYHNTFRLSTMVYIILCSFPIDYLYISDLILILYLFHVFVGVTVGKCVRFMQSSTKKTFIFTILPTKFLPL